MGWVFPVKVAVFAVTSPLTVNAFLVPQVRGLQDEGFDTHVVCSDDGIRIEDPDLEKRTVRVPWSRTTLAFADLIALLRLVVLLRRLRPDLLVYATPKASLISGVAGLIAGVSTRVHLGWGMRSEGIRSPLIRQMMRLLEGISVRCATHTFANSASLADAMQQLPLASRTAVTALGAGSSHGVDMRYFTPQPKLDAANPHFVIGFVGRVCEDKGVPELLQAQMALTSWGIPAQTQIVGPCEDPALCRHASETPGVVLHGPKAMEPSIYHTFDVLCLPSLREGFPNVCLEAAACQLPVVTTTATGCRDAVIHGVTGLLVPPGDAHALAEALLDLYRDRERRTAMGVRGRRWVESCFDERDVIREYTAAYARALVGGA